MTFKIGRYALQSVCAVALIALWQWASDTHRVRPFDFGQPSGIYTTLTTWWRDGTLIAATKSTLTVLLLGWGIGTVVGVLIGLLIGISSLAHDILQPFITFVYGIPRLILLPFLVIWFGFGLAPKVLLVVLTIWIITALSVAEGVTQIPKELIDNARLLGARRGRLVRDVYAPSLALWITSSSRTTFGFAFQAAIVSEFVGANEGLGHLIVVGQNGFRVDAIFAALVIVMILSIVGNALLSLAESRATRWMPATRI